MRVSQRHRLPFAAQLPSAQHAKRDELARRLAGGALDQNEIPPNAPPSVNLVLTSACREAAPRTVTSGLVSCEDTLAVAKLLIRSVDQAPHAVIQP